MAMIPTGIRKTTSGDGLAISGSRVVVGAYGYPDGDGDGIAYVFDLASPTTVQCGQHGNHISGNLHCRRPAYSITSILVTSLRCLTPCPGALPGCPALATMPMAFRHLAPPICLTWPASHQRRRCSPSTVRSQAFPWTCSARRSPSTGPPWPSACRIVPWRCRRAARCFRVCRRCRGLRKTRRHWRSGAGRGKRSAHSGGCGVGQLWRAGDRRLRRRGFLREVEEPGGWGRCGHLRRCAHRAAHQGGRPGSG